VTLRRRFITYLLFLHLVLAATVVALLWEHRVWLIAVELFLILSGLFAMKLFRSLFQPLESLVAGAEWLRERDFSTRLRLSGQEEMDTLIGVYNKMIDTLRDERLNLQEQQYFLEKVIRASPAGIITLDYDNRIVLVNPATERMLQVTGSHLAGMPLREMPSPISEVLAEMHLGESKILTVHGVQKIKCTRSQFIDRGFPRSFFILEELTEELRQSEKSAYEKLIRLMTHEVNNSIGAANSLLHSTLLYKNQLREEDRNDFVSAISIAISRAEHLNAFMKNFADIVRLPKPARKSVNLRQLLEQICTLMRPECEKRRIELRRDFAGAAGITMEIDRDQMEQALVNILKNAIESIQNNGVITVRAGKTNGNTVICIEDNGVGISPEAKNLLFTPFYSTKENGQGIGLTLVQEILTQHQFRYSLETVTGGLTRFSIYSG